MKKVIIFHGATSEGEYLDRNYPTASNSHWIPWLQKELMIRGFHVYAPEIQHPYKPMYKNWLQEINRFDITEDTILVGHSRGGAFILRYLTDNPDIKVGKVVLAAPSYEPPSWDTSDFYDYKVDGDISSRTNGIYLFVSDDDKEHTLRSASLLEKEVEDIDIIRFKGKGHFTAQSMGTVEFPELLEVF